MGVFDLTAEQLKKLKALEKAYKACIKENMLPVNIYGNLTFYNKQYIEDYGDSNSGFDKQRSLELRGDCRTFNSFQISNEWTDDNHILLFTEKGKELFEQDKEHGEY